MLRALLHAAHTAAAGAGAQTEETQTPLVADASDDDDLSPEKKLVYVSAALFLTLLAGLMSGLTLG